MVKSDLCRPEPLYETLSLWLLLALGLKSGIEQSKQPVPNWLPQMIASMALGFDVPLVLHRCCV